jgi:hypothetical protein
MTVSREKAIRYIIRLNEAISVGPYDMTGLVSL